MAKSGGGSDYDFIFKLVLIGDGGVGKVWTHLFRKKVISYLFSIKD